MGWGLASENQQRMLEWLLPDAPGGETRRRIALDHLAKCLHRARAFAASLDVPAVPPTSTRLYLFAGDAEPTPAIGRARPGTDKVEIIETRPGDKTVLRSSALMDERLDGQWSARLRSPVAWTNVTFLFTDHLGLTKSTVFTDNVLHLLLESPR
jgi:hypothetical protein